MSFQVEPESSDDAESIRAVHLAAFPTSDEADLVRMLNEDSDSVISLVAKDHGQIIGHVLLSRMDVQGDGRKLRALGLAPVAVLPDRQRNGIGSALIREAMQLAEKRGEELVFVVGEPDYYGRFDFSTEAAMPFASPYSGAYFMARSLGAPLPASGTAAYAPAFRSLS
jgi:putative acetyltransferase